MRNLTHVNLSRAKLERATNSQPTQNAYISRRLASNSSSKMTSLQGIKDIDELEEPFIYSQGNTEEPVQTLEILSEIVPDKSPTKNEEVRSHTRDQAL